MQCSTKTEDDKALNLVEQHWANLEARLGIDLEQTARETKALQRVRAIRSAADLLHLVLFYAVSGWGLRLTGAWALVRGIGYLSNVAVLNRIRKSRLWLGKLVLHVVARRCASLKALAGVRLRIFDATCVSRPGSQGTDWRIHLSFDLGNLCIDQVEVTDQHAGESLARFQTQNNEIVLVDGGYALATGMGPFVAGGGHLVVRINWRNVAVRTLAGQRFHIVPWLRALTGPAEQSVELETPQGWFSFRLIAAPIPPEKAEEARRKVRQRYQRKQRPLSQDTLFAAGFVTLLSNLPPEPWSAPRVLSLYRIRWQIELLFKRLKSLLLLGQLPAKDPNLAQTYLLAKLLVALLVDEMIHQVSLQQPEWFASLKHPVNLSRWTRWFFEGLRQAIFGPWPFHKLPVFLCVMRRYFCDAPRKRPQQLALARALLDHLTFSSPFPLS